jgi:hypothetical protein
LQRRVRGVGATRPGARSYQASERVRQAPNDAGCPRGSRREPRQRTSCSRSRLAHRECSGGSEDGCLRVAQECAGLGFVLGGLPPPLVGSRQLDLALRRACQRAAQSVRPSCDAVSGRRCEPTPRMKEEALEKCRSGTIDDCAHYAEVYSRPESFDSQLRVQLIQEACKKGGTSNCARLSEILAVGGGLPPEAARALEVHDRETKAGLDELKKCDGPGCAIAQLAYKARGEMMEQIRRAEIAPDAVARECEAGRRGACEGLRDAYRAGASRLPADPAKANAFGAKANQLVERQCAPSPQKWSPRCLARLVDSVEIPRAAGNHVP